MGSLLIVSGPRVPWFLDSFTQAAAVKLLDYVILLPPVNVCVERVRNRDGHGFTDEAATRSMHAEFSAGEIPTRHVIGSAEDSLQLAEPIVSLQTSGTIQYRIP